MKKTKQGMTSEEKQMFDCMRKERYAYLIEVADALDYFAQQKRAIYLDYYFCKYCKGYHLCSV